MFTQKKKKNHLRTITMADFRQEAFLLNAWFSSEQVLSVVDYPWKAVLLAWKLGMAFKSTSGVDLSKYYPQ